MYETWKPKKKKEKISIITFLYWGWMFQLFHKTKQNFVIHRIDRITVKFL